jgi:hypothetical protein
MITWLLLVSTVVALVDDKKELQELDSMRDVLPEEKMPARIVPRLKRYPRIVR